MLDPELIVTTVVTALRTLAPLNSLLGLDSPDPAARRRISGFYFEGGTENTFSQVLYKIPQPGVLVLWKGTVAGNFDGQSVFKHQIEVYIRSGNMALPLSSPPTGPAHLWWLICNSPCNSTTLNIRQLRLLPNLDPMDNPSIVHRQDEELLDFFCGQFTFPEVGDD